MKGEIVVREGGVGRVAMVWGVVEGEVFVKVRKKV